MIIGLTGSIAMGKTATADMFRQLGYPVFDSDTAVHKLYAQGGEAAKEIAKIYPDVINKGAVDRKQLVDKIAKNPEVLARIEKIVHPLVGEMEKTFVSTQQKRDVKLIIMDIPLLFEADREKDVDKIIVVSAPPDIQEARALERPGMTIDKFKLIMSKQLPDNEKRQRADFVIDTGKSLEETFEQVKKLVAQLDPDNPNIGDLNA